MPVETTLDAAFTTLVTPLLRAGAPGTGGGTPLPGTGGSRPATINFSFGGGGAAIIAPTGTDTALATTSDPQLVEVPFACVITRAHLYAGTRFGDPVAVTATVDLTLSQFQNFGTGSPLYGTGSRPALAGQYSANIDISGWRVNLNNGDAIIARLASFTGTATWVSLVLGLLPVESPQNIVPVVDSGGNQVVDLAGNPVVTG
jgi:hypothetical protein